MPLIFRSRIWVHSQSGTSTSRSPLSGSDWSDIRAYAPTDDSRDIIWTKSTNTENIVSKKRESNSMIPIRVLVDTNAWDEFFTHEDPTSRHAYKKSAEILLAHAAKRGLHPYKSAYGDIETLTQDLKKERLKNTLIIVLSSQQSPERLNTLKEIHGKNDIIYIHVFHSYEDDPTDQYMFFGEIFAAKKYKHYTAAHKKIESECRDVLDHIWGSYVRVSTRESLEHRLGYFFKHRFHHG